VVEDATPVCERCHGGDGSAAPPRGVHGETATTERAVGAHRAHLEGGRFAGPAPCEACHVVPAAPGAGPGGHAGDGPIVTFGALARTGLAPGSSPSWDREARTCSNVYCHGATLADGSNTTPAWTSVGAGQAACGTCHGNPPASHAGFGVPGAGAAACRTCHRGTVLASGAVDVAGGLHLDGAVEVSLVGGGGTGCGRCHGAPPDTGAHRRHAAGVPAGELAYGDLRVREDWAAPGEGYAFGCGHCHPVDPALHLADAGGDGLPDVALAPPSPPVPGDRLKARSAAWAALDRETGTCHGAACHSDDHPQRSYAFSPPWTSPPRVLACDGCHGNPPLYGSGPPGSASANSHLQLQADGREWGHTLGLPGPWHGQSHGVRTRDAAPITCQTCHFESVTGAGPSGFYWLDSLGTWHLGGAGQAALSCETCHGATGTATAQLGLADPRRHVNGRRDVAFDPRTELPALDFLPLPPDRPTRPYWATGTITIPPGVDAIQEGRTLSLHLARAGWAPATRTCSDVACHLAQASVQWGTPHAGADACAACHGR